MPLVPMGAPLTEVSRIRFTKMHLGKGKPFLDWAGFPQLGNQEQVASQQVWEGGLWHTLSCASGLMETEW